MNSDIFEFDCYKQFLATWIELQPHRGRGTKSAIAKAIGCQPAYVSQVLNGNVHFSLEQAHDLTTFLGSGTEESHYLILLVQHGRAGTPELRNYFLGQLRAVIERRFNLRHRLGVPARLTKEDQQTYYSSWIYAAVHVLLNIPEFQTKEAIGKRIGISASRAADVLDFLVRAGLVIQKGQRFETSEETIHLGNDSPLIAQHHCNWRMKSAGAISDGDGEGLHYSSVISISEQTAAEIKSDLVNKIKSIKAKIRSAENEQVYSFCLDFFSL